MIRFRTSILAGIIGFAALASGPAQADLYVFVDGTQQAFHSGNTSVNYDCSGTCADGFTKIDVTLLGQANLLNPEILDSGTQNATAATGATTLMLEAAETNLTAAGVEGFLQKFTGTLNGNLDVTRTFYVDSSNGTSTSDSGVTQLAQIVTNCTSTLGCNSAMTSTNFAPTGNSKYSVIETINIVPSGSGGNMSTDDFLYNVPEPVSLSLFGSGLLGLGALSRRRRKAPKSA